jgi:hypothetical protein
VVKTGNADLSLRHLRHGRIAGALAQCSQSTRPEPAG